MKQVRLAFSGSGFLAPIHAGAICALMDQGVDIVEVAGTSGGSIAAALVAAGFTSKGIKELTLSDLPSDILSFDLLALWGQGINDGSSLLGWLEDALGDVTFTSSKVPITIMATDIDNGIAYRLARDTASGTTLAEACRASASVPFIFQPFHLNGVKCVDGGVCCNMPLDQLVLDHVPQVGIEVMDGSTKGSTSTLIGFAKQCLSSMLASNEANLVAWGKMFDAKVIQIDAMPYGFLDASLSSEAKLDLFSRGYKAAENLAF
ncbi:MAG: patatin-like phospholipase family protein [Patescibacteria group bacterium]|nr:patatin-like phospholipase family protein [Patescibacteria group bacterium]